MTDIEHIKEIVATASKATRLLATASNLLTRLVIYTMQLGVTIPSELKGEIETFAQDAGCA